ncbi:cyclic AMP-dependent transcription factor ATF-4-like [Saccoglossus kowalevskii]|uniref:Cyclic AMP-dependent transcription factor ATF-4-like n=1 Tax=Saccoglossus kowalevskii TaxID=10224 RepID=A0ABM0GN43_SACKO|nr:PREDICTED: cyclic AMP-dependent transcription factor ATF-4-like [Saccoglossus kowalevskii]
MPPVLVNSEVDELQELAVSPADLELLNSLVVNSEVPPQPVSPGENTAPHLLALSPMSSPPPSRSDSPMPFLSIPENTDIPSLIPAATLLGVLVQQSQEQLYLSNQSISSETSLSLQNSPSPSPSVVSYTSSEVQEEVISDSPKRSKSKLKTASGTKYGKFTDRKSRKRDQNKAAATRYREKKKAEADGIHTEEERLVAKNTSLKEQVDSLTREIQYMKELMVDVYKAKGMI